MCGGNEEERRDKATTKPNEKRDAKTTTTEAVTSPNEFMNMRLSGLRSPVWQARLHPCPLPPCPLARVCNRLSWQQWPQMVTAKERTKRRAQTFNSAIFDFGNARNCCCCCCHWYGYCCCCCCFCCPSLSLLSFVFVEFVPLSLPLCLVLCGSPFLQFTLSRRGGFSLPLPLTTTTTTHCVCPAQRLILYLFSIFHYWHCELKLSLSKYRKITASINSYKIHKIYAHVPRLLIPYAVSKAKAKENRKLREREREKLKSLGGFYDDLRWVLRFVGN